MKNVTINVSGPVGSLTLGPAIGDIENKLGELPEDTPEAIDFGRALHVLAEAIVASYDLDETLKKEALQDLRVLAEAGAQKRAEEPPPKETTRAFTKLSAIVNTAASLTTLWDAYGADIARHLGLS